MRQFLERDGLQLMLNMLSTASAKASDFGDAVFQLMVIRCVKRLLNSQVGLTFLIEGHSDLVRDFACTLDTGNIMVKNQVCVLIFVIS